MRCLNSNNNNFNKKTATQSRWRSNPCSLCPAQTFELYMHIYFELGSYHAKLEGNFHDERDISVGDEFSACIWFKTVEGA